MNFYTANLHNSQVNISPLNHFGKECSWQCWVPVSREGGAYGNKVMTVLRSCSARLAVVVVLLGVNESMVFVLGYILTV